MGKLLPDANAGAYENNITGDMSFQRGRLFIPTTNTLPTSGQAGDIVFLDDEGLLLVSSGGNPIVWHTYSLSGIIPNIDPTDLPNLVFWFDAASGQTYTDTGKDTTTEDAGDVGLWNDKSGNGNDANQFAAGAPTFQAAAFAGFDVVRFDASEGMNVSGVAGLANGTDPEFAYFALINFATVGAQNIMAAGNAADTTNFIEIKITDASEYGTRKADDSPSITKIGGGVPDTSGLYLLHWGTQDNNAQLLSMFQNGSGLMDREAYTTTQDDYTIDTFSLGGKQDSGGEATSLDADVVELIAYSGQITNDHRVALQQYFTHKYAGLTMSGIT